MTPLLERIKGWWRSADKTQKLVTVFGSAFLVLLLGGVFYFSSRPQYAILFADLSPTELAAVQTELEKQGVPNTVDASRTVSVPRSEVTRVQARLAAAGVAPNDIRKFGYKDLSDIGMMNSPQVEGTKITAIHEGVLADMIQTLDPVQDAVVKISPMDDSPFAVERRPATASIVVRERSSKAATSDLGSVIAGLVSNAVQGLQRENVTVTTTEGRTLFDGKTALGANGMVSEKIQAQRDEAERRRRELQEQLDVAFGRGATVVHVAVEMDFDKANTVQEKREPSETPVQTEKVEEKLRNAGQAGAGGIAGTAPNTAPGSAPATAQDGSKDFSSTQSATKYLENYSRVIKEAVPGTVTSMSINVLADSSRISAEGQQTLTNTVNGFLGPKTEADGFKATVNFVEFDKSAAQAAAKEALVRDGQDQMQRYFSLLPIAALLVVGLMVIRSLKKVAVPPSGSAGVAGGGREPLPLDPGSAAGVSPTLVSEIDHIADPLHEGTHGQLPPGHRDPDAYDESDEIEPLEIGSKTVNKPLQQIYMMAEQKPEDVATLVKAWLKEDLR
ncbi:MAG: hypothetical protein KIS66_06485 [Fimbriimonadaceae bacterium]|nr:hypothetical protein [Fimbriimonadaceae bacterium]